MNGSGPGSDDVLHHYNLLRGILPTAVLDNMLHPLSRHWSSSSAALSHISFEWCRDNKVTCIMSGPWLKPRKRGHFNSHHYAMQKTDTPEDSVAVALSTTRTIGLLQISHGFPKGGFLVSQWIQPTPRHEQEAARCLLGYWRRLLISAKVHLAPAINWSLNPELELLS